MWSNFHPRRLFLDASIAAVLTAVLGLTFSFCIQELTFNRPAFAPTSAGGSMDCRTTSFSIPVVAETGGNIRSIHVVEGSAVRTGDVLVQLDTTIFSSAIKSLIRRIHFRELEHRSDLSRLYRELEKARIDLGRRTIVSPADGHIIASASLHPGEMLSAGAAVALIQSHSSC